LRGCTVGAADSVGEGRLGEKRWGEVEGGGDGGTVEAALVGGRSGVEVGDEVDL
jgi:hypothetical protein